MPRIVFLDAFHTRDDGIVRISAAQGSRFAKEIAGDYNPIHDPGSSRFCVPGDLLASLVLGHYGLSERMAFHFRGMVGAGEPLHFPKDAGESFALTDEAGKACLQVERSGATVGDPDAVEGFIRHYVAFSGQTFPHYLKPLMVEHGVMFNPDRPLVIYDYMGFDLQEQDFGAPELELIDGTLDIEGRRGDAVLDFRIAAGGRTVGTGAKHLLLSGLRPYDEARMDAFVAEFNRRKKAYEGDGAVD